MLQILIAFVAELRSAGIEVTIGDVLDAADAIESLPFTRRAYLESGLAASLVKSPEQLPLFRALFHAFFSEALESAIWDPFGDVDDHGDPVEAGETLSGELGRDVDGRVAISEDDLWQLLLEALSTGDPDLLQFVAAAAVRAYAHIHIESEPNVGYFLNRVLRSLRLREAVALVLVQASEDLDAQVVAPSIGARFEARLLSSEVDRRAEDLKALIAEELRRLFVGGYGIRAVVAELRGSLLDEVDLVHASAEELKAIRRALIPLSRLFANRLRQSHRTELRGRLDFRRTIRRSLSTGGTMSDAVFRKRTPRRPEMFLLADVSGSVAAFATFIFSFTYALSRNLPNTRVAVFVNRVDEVTEIFDSATSLDDAISGLARASSNLHQGGDSDYGAALEGFRDTILSTLDHRTRLIIVGDGRTNHTEPRSELLGTIRRDINKVYWLNPEPRQFWGAGDSAMTEYSPFCDAVFECRNLAQIRTFVAAAR